MRFGVKAAGIATGQGLKGYLQHRFPPSFRRKSKDTRRATTAQPKPGTGGLALGLNGAARPTRAPAGTEQHN